MRRLLIFILTVALLSIPMKAGRTANGTSDFMQASLSTHGIFRNNIVGQPQGSISFYLNLISFPSGSTTFPCSSHCGEIVNVVASHQASVNQCQTVSGACLDIFVCGSGNAFCGLDSIWVDITTPNVAEIEAVWPMTTGLHLYTFLMNRTATSIQLYKDGVLVTQHATGGGGDPGPINYAAAGGGCRGGNCALTVMAGQGNIALDSFANGTISNLAFWNVTLNAGEIKSLANCVPPNRIEPEHVSYYPLYGVDSPEPNYNSLFLPLPLTLTGTTKTLQQVGCQPGGAYH